jgi:LPXTG-motif cell wall-anchored protein
MLTRVLSLTLAALLVITTCGGWKTPLFAESTDVLAPETQQAKDIQQTAEATGEQTPPDAVKDAEDPAEAPSANAPDPEKPGGGGGATPVPPAGDGAPVPTTDTPIRSTDTLEPSGTFDALQALSGGLSLLSLEPLLGTLVTETAGFFTITADTTLSSTDYEYTAGVLTIKSDTSMTISLTGPESTTTDTILINPNLTSAANITLADVSIDVSSSPETAALEVGIGASLNLTLKGSNTLKSGAGCAGLQLDERANLTITADSNEPSLAATGGGGENISAAGIGGGNNTGTAGDITIKGGTITAIAGTSAFYGAAGIGGGYTGSPVGSITITNSTIAEATAGSYGAGIGGGYTGSPVGSITITNSTIAEATGGFYGGAGIGGGYGGGGNDTSGVTGAITITNSTITKATAANAGIGGGYNSPVGSITIVASTITKATSGSIGGAGIGGGFGYDANGGVTGAITITDSTIAEATGGFYDGAGIGGGVFDSPVGSITIAASTITKATGGFEGGAGIGGGNDTSGVIGAITITGGIVTAMNTNENSQDIGNGFNSTVTSVVIDGGSVWATNGKVAYGDGSLPINSDGDEVYPNTLTIGSPAVGDDVSITAGIIDGFPCDDTPDADHGVYGIKNVKTALSGKVCFWLPDTENRGSDVGEVGLVADGTDFELSYARSGAVAETLFMPAILSIAPHGTAHALNGEVELSFNVGMDTSASGTVVLKPASGSPIPLDPATGRWNSSTAYTIPYRNLAYATTYTIEMEGFASAVFGSELNSDDTTFTTAESSVASTPASKDFTPARAGYIPPEAQLFTLTNRGTVALTGLKASIVGADDFAFGITAALSSSTIAVDGTATLSAQPVAGLAPSDTAYKATLHLTGDGGFVLDIPLSFTVETFKATIDPPDGNFGTEEAGYAPRTLTFTITNTGSGPLAGLDVFLEGQEGQDISAFSLDSVLSPLEVAPLGITSSELSPSGLSPSGTFSLEFSSLELTPSDLSSLEFTPFAVYSLAPGQHLTVTAHPTEGLAPRNTPYTSTLRVTAPNGIDLSVTLSFAVKASGGGGGGSGTLPRTGDSLTLPLVAVGLTFAVLGAGGLVVAVRRRRTGY